MDTAVPVKCNLHDGAPSLTLQKCFLLESDDFAHARRVFLTQGSGQLPRQGCGPRSGTNGIREHMGIRKGQAPRHIDGFLHLLLTFPRESHQNVCSKSEVRPKAPHTPDCLFHPLGNIMFSPHTREYGGAAALQGKMKMRT